MDVEQAIAQSHLICVDVMENHNKFWSAWVLENGDLLVEYGRVGSTAQSKLHAIGNVNAATTKMNALVKQKRAKGYQAIAIADSKSLDFSLLTNGSAIQDEIEDIQQQWKRMEPFSLIRFHPESGQFRSLSGSLSMDVVTIARSLLERTGIGHLPNVQGLNLEAAGVDYDAACGIRIDDFLRTSNPQIYAAGDVCLEHMYTHTAAASARIVVQNALFRGSERLSALIVPWCTFTDPEIAHVGLCVREAIRQYIPVKTFTVPMHENTRALTDSENGGFVKIHVREGTDQILGATIVARHAGDMINEITLAMVAGIGLRTLARVIHAYPTQAEAIRQAADAYSRTRLTPRIRARLRHWLAGNA